MRTVHNEDYLMESNRVNKLFKEERPNGIIYTKIGGEMVYNTDYVRWLQGSLGLALIKTEMVEKFVDGFHDE